MAGYNKELEALDKPTWFNVPWLYAECYLYRYVLYTAGSHTDPDTYKIDV